MSAIGDLLRNNFPTNLDKTSDNFKTLIANYEVDEITEENIDQLGLMEYLLYNMYKLSQEYSQNTDVYNWNDVMFDRLAKFICTSFIRYHDADYLRRTMGIFFNRSQIQWGTKEDIKSVYKAFYGNDADVFCVDNSKSFSENLLINGDFENEGGWGNGLYFTESRAAFCGNRAAYLKFQQYYITQSVTLEPGRYSLNMFANGDATVTITISSENVIVKPFLSNEDKYIHRQVKFDIENTCTITIKVENKTQNVISYVDFIRLFKIDFPCFSVIARFLGLHAAKKVVLSDENGDPVGTEFEDTLYGYLNTSFLNGAGENVADTLEDYIMDYLRPVGVKGYTDVVVRDFEGDSDEYAYVVDTTLVLPYGSESDETLEVNRTIEDGTLDA